MEKFNARNITRENVGGDYDIITIDVSFISLELILPALVKVLAPGGAIVALVKPQFEAGRDEVQRGGIVKDPQVHQRVVQKIIDFGVGLGLELMGQMESPITGAKGNKEFLAAFLRK